MLRIWDEFIKKEELESSPGVIDQDRVRALTLNTYLTHIRDMVMDGENQFPEFVSDHLETTMMCIFMDQTYVLEGRRPDDEEIRAYLNDPVNVEARENLRELCVKATPGNWPEIEEKLKEMAPVADLDKINWDSEERKKNAENWQRRFEENGGVIEL